MMQGVAGGEGGGEAGGKRLISLLDGLLQGLPVAACILDARRRVIRLANVRFARLVRASEPAALAGRELPEVLTAELRLDADELRPIVDAATRAGAGHEGTSFCLHVPDAPLEIGFGPVVEGVLLMTARRVERHRQGCDEPNEELWASVHSAQDAARQAVEHAAELDAVIAAIVDPVFVYSVAGAIVCANNAAAGLCGGSPVGWTQDELVQRFSIRLASGELLSPDMLASSRAIAGGSQVSVQYTTTAVDGSERLIVSTASPWRVGGRLAGVVAVWRDVTVTEHLVRDLRARTEELAEADRRKSQFIAILSHELRNPLAAISTAAYLVERRGVLEPLRKPMAIIGRQVQHLTRMVDDLLDVSRITHDRVDLHKALVDLRENVLHAVESVRPVLEERRQQVTLAISDAPLVAEADATRIDQVLSNVIDNAVKYAGEAGHIWVEADTEGDDNVIRVRDDGVGITPELLPRVFDLFSQADGTLARSNGGLGLGLSIARKIVELHGGVIQAHSPGLGQGSEFTIRLPRHEVSARPDE